MSRLKSQTGLHESLPVGSRQRGQLIQSFRPRLSHGGSLSIRKRKTARPFSPKAPMHLVLRSTRAKGAWSLSHRKNRSRITSMIYFYAARFGVQVYRAKIEGSHLQLLVKSETRKPLADFLRVIAGRIAVTITGARKRVKRIGKFWDYLYWSKMINWGQDFFSAQNFIQNHSIEHFEGTNDPNFSWICELTPQ